MAIRQSTISAGTTACVVLLASLLGAGVLFTDRANQREERAVARQAAFMQLGAELYTFSKYLTGEVRSYVVTGERTHMDNYWNEIDVNQTDERILTELTALGAREDEFELITESKDESDGLVNTEARAMRLMLEADGVPEANMPAQVATVRLSESDQLLSADEKRAVARTIVFDDTYARNEQKILAPIQEFQDRVNARAASEVADARSSASRAQWLLIALAALVPAAVGAILWIIHRQVSAPIGDYTHDLRDYDIAGPEFALIPAGTMELRGLAEAFNDQLRENRSHLQRNTELLDSHSMMAADVRTAASTVGTASTELLTMTEQISSATMEVSNTIQYIAQGSAHQAEQVNAVSDAIEQMNRTVESVARGAQEQQRTLTRAVELTHAITEHNQQVAQAAQAGLANARRNAERAREGNVTVRRAVAAMADVRGRVEAASLRVAEMGQRSQQIGDIVSAIEDLTDQTNLLALNAAIEAARAGEAGRGFAVVAEEVRKLAERSSQSMQEISTLVQAVQASVSEAVSAMQAGAVGVETVTRETDDVRLAFESILQAAGALEAGTREIADAAGQTAERSRELLARTEDTSVIADSNAAAASQMADSSTQVRNGIRTVSVVTEQNAAAAEQVSAATEQTATQLEEVTGAAQILQNLAFNLQQLVDRFAGNADAVAQTGDGDRHDQAASRHPGRESNRDDARVAAISAHERRTAAAATRRSLGFSRSR